MQPLSFQSHIHSSVLRRTLAGALLSLSVAGCDAAQSTLGPTAEHTEEAAGDLQLNASVLEMRDGEATQLQLLHPSGAVQAVLGGGVDWVSTNTAVAEVDARGVVTARRAGEALVKANTRFGPLTARVKVQSKRSISISPKTASIEKIGDKTQLSATVHNRGGKVTPGAKVTWASLDPAVAKVDAKGRVTGKAAGLARITATAQSGAADTAAVAVSSSVATQIASVSVSPDATTTYVEESVQMKAAALNVDGQAIPGVSFLWASSDESIATVSSGGLVTSRAQGTAVITAAVANTEVSSYSGSSAGVSFSTSVSTAQGSVKKSGSGEIVVRGKRQLVVSVAPEAATLNAIGNEVQLAASVEDAQGRAVTCSNVEWTSLNPQIASVDEMGRVISKAVGVVSIVAACGGGSDTAQVTSRQVVASVDVSPATGSVEVDRNLQFNAAAADSNGVKVDGAEFAWSSTNPAVAVVSSTGVVKGVAPGSATIRAKAGSHEKASSVTVKEAVSAPAPPPPGPSSSVAELPRVRLDTEMPRGITDTIRVAAGGDLQKAIDEASSKQSAVVLIASGEYRGSFRLPARSGSGWVVIRSDAAIPAEGTRVTPTAASGFARLVGGYEPAVKVVAGAQRYRLVGLEVTTAASETQSRPQVEMEPGSEYIFIDRSYVHGHPNLSFQRCIMMNANSAAVIDSYVSECHGKGFDSQAIAGWKLAGPAKIVNNYLAGAGENVMFGGSPQSIEGQIASDIEIRRNHFHKPLSWKGVWTVKNLFELKNAQRVLVEGNVFDGNWKDAQVGFAIQLTPRGEQGKNPWATVADVTFRYNIIRNSAAGINILGWDNNGGSDRAQRILIAHNRMEKIGKDSAYGNNGRGLQMLKGPIDVHVLNNTLDAQHSVMFWDAESDPVRGLRFEDNRIDTSAYGIFGNGTGEALSSWSTHTAGDYRFVGNALAGRKADRYPNASQNAFPTSLSGYSGSAGVDESKLSEATRNVVQP